VERGDIDADCLNPLERIVLRFTTELVHGVRASEPVFSDIARHLSAREIVELILAVGLYMALARLIETTDVDLDPRRAFVDP
jgi:alkylhydroperoxidase family enzyme